MSIYASICNRYRDSVLRIVVLGICSTLTLDPELNAYAADEVDLRLWRLDCGEMFIEDISYFSDSFDYEGQSAQLSNGCYLIQNGDRYLLWEAGIPLDYFGNTEMNNGWLETVTISIADQLAQLSLTTEDIDFLGISHFHGDHIGQAIYFTKATLLMSEADTTYLRNLPPRNARTRLKPWFEGERELVEIRNDHDVFDDGTVKVIALPGHTPGHQGLLVNLPKTGPVLLSGDLYHFHAEIGQEIVSRWNSSRADTLASFKRLERIVDTLDPIVVVQHDPKDDDLLPRFPEAAE